MNPLCWCSSGFGVHYGAEIMEWNFISKWIKVVALPWCCGAFYASADQYLFTTWWRKKKIQMGGGLSFPTRCPEAKQFSPMVGTCKKKSNLLKRALEYVNSSWRRSGCARACCLSPRTACCQMYPMGCMWGGRGGCSLTAGLWQPEPISQRPRQEGDPIITPGLCCWMSVCCRLQNRPFWMSLKVPYAYSCRAGTGETKTHGRTASGQMCRNGIHGINIYVPVHMPGCKVIWAGF